MSPPSGTIASAPSASTDSPSARCSSERRGRPVIVMPSVSTAAVVARASGVERPLVPLLDRLLLGDEQLGPQDRADPEPEQRQRHRPPSTGVNHVYDSS